MAPSKHLIIVDDDRTNADLIGTFLVENGFRVDYAYTAEQGRQKIAASRPDMVILDLFLPDGSGSDICRQMRASSTTRDIPVILITAHQISHVEKMEGFRSGVDDYLVRPFELGELVARINAIFRRSTAKPKDEVLAGIEALIPRKTAVPPPAPSVSPAPAAAPRPFTFQPPKQEDTAKAPAPSHRPLQFFQRTWALLNRPFTFFSDLRVEEDFLLGLIFVLATPLIGSFANLAPKTDVFDAWIGVFSLGLLTNATAWVGVAGLLTLTLPFLGENIPMKKALTIAGLSWAPRLLASIFSFIYGGIAGAGFMLTDAKFSSGLDLLPGLSSSSWTGFLSHLGLFELWSVMIVLVSVWTICGMREKKWNAVTVLIGVACLGLGFISAF